MFRRKTKAARCRNCDQDFGHRIPRDKPLSLCFPCAAREKLSDQMDARERALAEPEPTPVAPPPDAQDFLADALDAIASRAQERDAEGGERSMARAVDMFNAYLADRFLSELAASGFIMFFKLARSAAGGRNPFHHPVEAGAIRHQHALGP